VTGTIAATISGNVGPIIPTGNTQNPSFPTATIQPNTVAGNTNVSSAKNAETPAPQAVNTTQTVPIPQVIEPPTSMTQFDRGDTGASPSISDMEGLRHQGILPPAGFKKGKAKRVATPGASTESGESYSKKRYRSRDNALDPNNVFDLDLPNTFKGRMLKALAWGAINDKVKEMNYKPMTFNYKPMGYATGDEGVDEGYMTYKEKRKEKKRLDRQLKKGLKGLGGKKPMQYIEDAPDEDNLFGDNEKDNGNDRDGDVIMHAN
jgi:hypothetical protein